MSNIYGQTRECFACEKNFRPVDALNKSVPLDFCESYCSNECYQQFQEELAGSIEQAKAAGLVDAEGNAILQTNTTPHAVRTVLQGLGIKLKSGD